MNTLYYSCICTQIYLADSFWIIIKVSSEGHRLRSIKTLTNHVIFLLFSISANVGLIGCASTDALSDKTDGAGFWDSKGRHEILRMCSRTREWKQENKFQLPGNARFVRPFFWIIYCNISSLHVMRYSGTLLPDALIKIWMPWDQLNCRELDEPKRT